MLRYWQEVFLERKGCPIFFDLDGPILDVSQRHYEVYCDILREAGKPPTSFERYWQGKRARQPLAEIVSENAGADFYRRYFEPEWFARIEAEKYLVLDRMWPWAIDVLADLYRDHDLYLVTVRSDPEQLQKQLKGMSLERWFRTVLCRPARQNAGQEKAKAIREHFSSLPRQAIIVGDTEADMDCGRELGFVTVGVLSGIRDQDRLQSSKCDYIRENILEALPLIRDLSGGIQ
jgi:phosphoglycolate phosphatase-like HAD superfamily hydrolase